jgi:predicted DNA-binding antitoxin AbrB/MazE fold protein
MVREIRARYSNGKIEPLEPLELEEGEEVIVTVPEPRDQVARLREALRASAGAWEGLVDTDALLRDIYESRRSSRPSPWD